uniref:Uncharacterized protein n=1 Tax=Romanomermis culicivorax TaxID=13658 RepID=A0A915L6R3_ROMCU
MPACHRERGERVEFDVGKRPASSAKHRRCRQYRRLAVQPRLGSCRRLLALWQLLPAPPRAFQAGRWRAPVRPVEAETARAGPIPLQGHWREWCDTV